jgi:hypothetical protein
MGAKFWYTIINSIDDSIINKEWNNIVLKEKIKAIYGFIFNSIKENLLLHYDLYEVSTREQKNDKNMPIYNPTSFSTGFALCGIYDDWYRVGKKGGFKIWKLVDFEKMSINEMREFYVNLLKKSYEKILYNLTSDEYIKLMMRTSKNKENIILPVNGIYKNIRVKDGKTKISNIKQNMVDEFSVCNNNLISMEYKFIKDDHICDSIDDAIKYIYNNHKKWNSALALKVNDVTIIGGFKAI